MLQSAYSYHDSWMKLQRPEKHLVQLCMAALLDRDNGCYDKRAN